ncbi:MAG TPA: DNA repair ATPase [Verrucomicrobiae bacterium]|nr:DNA repair ATPase [Verrucomicrobiae bacterium]
MADEKSPNQAAQPPQAAAPAGAAATLGSATYEIIRQRLTAQGETLRERLSKLDARRQQVFGSVEFKLLQADRIVTEHNCIPRDMVQLGRGKFLFGFNVHFGLKREINLKDVFAVYARDEAAGTFKESDLAVLEDKSFIADFKRLYNVYEKTVFSKFSLIDQNLYMVFQIGPGVNDISVFKWVFNGGQLRYVDGRSETEFRKIGFPPQHQFQWQTPDRESFRYGDHPHISIEDRVFVECVGGDLTIKVEDNTKTGEGIYCEPVDDKKQKVDDAEIAYAIIGHLILLKIRPYKESSARYFIYNEKQQSAVRVDSIGQSCALLPEHHGLIFPDGYYLATGELKQFEAKERDTLVFEHVIHAPNGEDSLYIFYSKGAGEYALLPYRLISQKVEERISCHGFSLFADGNLISFRADDEAQKHHMIQLRQTPFYQPGHEPAGQKDAFLYQVGNKEVVHALADANQIVSLVRKENPYAEIYDDLVKRSGAILDSYPWLSSPEGFGVNEALRNVRDAADKAVDEFDKVRRLQREAVEYVKAARKRAEERFNSIRRAGFRALDEFVQNLAALRKLRGELISLKEVRYVDLTQIDETEKQVIAQTDELSKNTVKFLLKPEALDPYRKQADAHLAAAEKVTKVAEGKEIEKAVSVAAGELEMLIEIVNSLRIEDATEATRIIDGITSIYATLNQVRAALKNRLQTLAAAEGAAQFSAQMKLLSQSTSSYLDLCTTPAKCDEYLNRISVQLEELEGAFADFPEYTVELSEKRTSIYEAFEQRKVALVEQRNKKATALLAAAERILKSIQTRLAALQTIDEINTYMASDLMVGKIRDTIAQLLQLEDSVKADDLQGRLKSVQQEAVRQLKDRQELFVGGPGVISLGKHRFNINTQPLDLTVVNRDGAPNIHLTSTKYFDQITDESFLATRDSWDQEVVSENAEVYRAEFLAWRLLQKSEASKNGQSLPEVANLNEEKQLALVQEFMGSRYHEGYTKGVHDIDAAKIFRALASVHLSLGLARYRPEARACAVIFWQCFIPKETQTFWRARLKGFSERNRLFPGNDVQENYIASLRALIADFATQTKLFSTAFASESGEYLFYQLISGDTFVVSAEADRLVHAFRQHLASKGSETAFKEARRSLESHPAAEVELIRDWVRGFIFDRPELTRYQDEVVAVLCAPSDFKPAIAKAATTQTLEGLKGSHAALHEGKYNFDYLAFQQKLSAYEAAVVPRFEKYHAIKSDLIEKERGRLRLGDFKPKVLTSFVRNQLIDQVYLPLVGDNLAKQIGAAGNAKRTDLMGLLLLVSPPGYGKTTLVEYVAHRLGITFIKINGPAIGHAVTSLDPEEAPNAAAREEINKLNLALEMGDNVMICLDDIQHCSPEFLQKFISLCDAQRKIEGVWRGKPRTYDLRGRKVVVVMAGNPYTESGQKFKVPDMLANRADTYNLGDIIGANSESFKASYLENAITSNAVLAPLANKSQKDIRTFIRTATTGERAEGGFEASYSAQEVEEILAVMKKLVRIQEVVLRVNQEYIHSAGQADEFRTEPPFKLQGSYRNMNRMAEKIVTIMNDAEVMGVIMGHYQNEAQTLTTGAEANLLKFKEIIGVIAPEEKARWEEIKSTFKRNLTARDGDPVARIVEKLSTFQTGLSGIRETLEQLGNRPAPIPPPAPAAPIIDFSPIGKSLDNLRKAVEKNLNAPVAPPPPPPAPPAIDFSPLSKNLDDLRKAVEKKLSTPPPAPVIAPIPINTPAPSADLSARLTEGLHALREDLTRAITAVHKGAMAEKVDSLSHELEMIHSTLATLKDVAAQQRDRLKEAQDLLALRAKQGTVEIDLTQEMLTNERAFLERFHQVIAESQKSQPPEAQP